ncbi:MAG: hypothetical protein IKA05_03110 [Clostridia bacterium]|nr:hypothetical protein [Clostridia bacterium]
MKKRIFALLLSALLLTNVTACNTALEKDVENTFEDTNTAESTVEETETIARTKNYHYYKMVGTFELGCEIYNAAGEIIFSERSQRPMTVSEIDADLIEIRIGYGTGIIGRRYFSIEKNQMSEEFFYVVANHGTKIAYLTYSNGGLNDRKLMIQDIYQPIDSGQCFTLDFSPDHTPVIEAKFSEDGTTLFLKYFEGQIYATKEAEISLE